ncbi:MAG: sigma-54-dependent Fis family transcriptional regulator [Planctomycetes bacterium]|nr:sigma-54-dependent Fis family transcriptional regulator [Planctomycetota bacterium]
MSQILIVDDEPAIGWSLKELLRDGGHEVALAADVAGADQAAARDRPACILLDVRLGGEDGIAALPRLRAAAGGAPVVVMTAFGDLDTAVRAVQAGAFDYLVKPFDLERVAEVVRRALAEGPTTMAEAEPVFDADDHRPLVGSSPAMQEIYKQVALVAASDLPVLVTGPAGTGKDVVAWAIHAYSRRRQQPLVTTNLAALAPAAIEGELFGHASGDRERPGLIELAAGGTIVLDEIDQAPAEVQVKLLRMLETGESVRVGEAAARRIDIRVIAATDRDLSDPPAAGSFRHDLRQRLAVFTIRMPTLAERPTDVEPLARHFLTRHAAGRPGGPPAMSAEFLAALERRPWPGNVRELKHAVEYAAVMARGGTLRPEHLPRLSPATDAPGDANLTAAATRVGAAVKEWSAAARRELAGLPEPDLHHRAVQLVEAMLLREALAHTGGNRTAAAKLLGLDRATLRTKLRALGIDD